MILASQPIEKYQYFEGMPACSIVTYHSVADKHLHKETEIVYLLRGELDVVIEERAIHIGRGELLCIGENVLHQYGAWGKECLIIKMKFMSEWMMPSFLRQAEKEACFHLYNQSFLLHPDARIERIVREMLKYPETSYTEYYYLSRLIELTAIILQHEDLIKETRPLGLINNQYMAEALKYLEENCFRPLTLGMMADHLGLTACYFSKFFKKNTGIAFVQYLNAARVNNAQRLLMYASCNVTEVAERCGFSSIQTFNRVFKAQTGRTPREYRDLKRTQIKLLDL
ncbi:MAG: helix-turn-helix domain-containing protein [Christensenellales bacterium]